VSKIVIAYLQYPISSDSCPGWQALQPLVAWAEQNSIPLQLSQLPAVYKDSLVKLEQLINHSKPSHLLLVQQCPSISQIQLEKVASNVLHSAEADANGIRPTDGLTAQTGPAAYFSNLPVAHIIQAQHQQQLPVQLSYFAGTAVANHTFYGLMHYIKHQNTNLYGGLMQVPLLTQQAWKQLNIASISAELLRQSLQQLVLTCLNNHNNVLKISD